MTEVRINDTLSGELRPLDPGPDGRIGIYACGPTVYSRIHVGNARAFVVPMVLARYLRHRGLDPKVAINVTDVNDKIYIAAREAGVGSDEHARAMTRHYMADTDALGLGRPDAEPLATETMDEIVEMIGALVESGSAYESGGDVYFRVRSFDGYGALSNRETEEMDQGEEAGSASLKEEALDFALWKATKPGEDTAWDSPWGRGRPGWHIECSAMAERELGVPVSVHAGGVDLVFPHHENEIAQTVAARGKPLAKVWMHNGMVLTGPEVKMAKSEGNVFGLAEAISRFGAEAVLIFLLSGHYRQPLAFSENALEQAVARGERFRDFFRSGTDGDGEEDARVAAARAEFDAALADDFNTPRALGALFTLVADANREPVAGARGLVAELLEVLGLASLAAEEEVADAEALELLRLRQAARAERDFERADSLRDELAERGFDIRDTPAGPKLVPR